ncbi:MAG: hypothetical protein WC969_14945 [Elusimicrobiota bacterium]|jgi:hypothetical protein
MKLSACRSCGAPILWAETASGKKCPFDAKPTPAGEWALDDTTHPPLAAKIVRAEGSSESGFTCHFATCPNAAEHRRKR